MKLPKEIIDINEDWGISSDSSCVTIYKKSIHKGTGKLYYSATWHYNDFVQALQGLVDRGIYVEHSFENIVDQIKKLREEIKVLFDKVKGGIND